LSHPLVAKHEYRQYFSVACCEAWVLPAAPARYRMSRATCRDLPLGVPRSVGAPG